MSELLITRIHEAETIPLERRVQKPHLRVLPSFVPRKQSWRALGIAVGAIVVPLIGVMIFLMNAGLENTYEIDRLTTAQAAANRDEQALKNQLDRTVSPQYLAANAEALGMIPNNSAAYLRLSDGAVLGAPAAAKDSLGANIAIPNALSDGAPLTPAAQKVIADRAIAAAAAQKAAAAAQATDARLAPTIAVALPVPVTH